MRTMLAVAAMVFASAFVASAALAEQIDNPQYKQWAAYKPGTWVKIKTVTDSAGNKMEMEATTKLAELTPEKAVIETSQKMKVAGNDMDMPAQKLDVPAKIEKPTAPATPGDAPKPEVKQGEEELTVAGQKIKCKTMESTSKSGDMTVQSKSWTSDEVPGSIVKMESKTQGTNASTMSMELVGMEIKK